MGCVIIQFPAPVLTEVALAALLPVPSFDEPKAPVVIVESPRARREGEGAKYDPSLSTTEIAARIRAEVKDAVRAGKLPRGLKVGVRSSSYSGGSSINIVIKRAPFVVLNPARAAWEASNPHAYPGDCSESRYTAEASRVADAITAIAHAYNFDHSDAQSDYFHVNFYGGDAKYDWRLTDAECASFVAFVAG